MKKILLFATLVLGTPLPGFAQESSPAPTGPVSATGKILVLENERTLEGDIERIGDQYRIRRAIGETWVPGDRALYLCSKPEQAYQYLRGRSNLNDPDERLKLAQWCHNHGLPAQALTEVQAAVKLRPDHPVSRRLLEYLQEQTKQPRPAAPPTQAIPEIDTRLALNVELTGEALGQFTTRVQPILMNSCATCHATGRGGPFRLNRIHEQANRRVTQQNLVSVLSTLNFRQPEASPFLTKALSMHGEMTQAPFRNRQTPAYRALEDWVHLTISNNPHAAEAGRTEGTHTPAVFAATSTAVPSAQPAEPPVATNGGETKAFTAARPPAPGTTPSKAPPMPSPDDPYDPEHFNQVNSPAPVAPMPQHPPGRPGP
jgi:hypothetical protein